jgi:hypothetical protein
MAANALPSASAPMSQRRRIATHVILGATIFFSACGGGVLIDANPSSAAPSPGEIANILDHDIRGLSDSAHSIIYSLSKSRIFRAAAKHLKSEGIKEAVDDACKVRDLTAFLNDSASGQKGYLELYFGASPRVAQAAAAAAEDLNDEEESGDVAANLAVQSACFGISASQP